MHKTRHHGKTRVIAIGPKCQEMLAPYLAQTNESDYVFSLRCNVDARAAESYTRAVYGINVKRACDRAGVPRWTPNQIRHTYGTQVRKEFSLEHAGAALGHAKMNATEVYALRDASLAASVAAQIG
jgi:integrase